MQLRFKYGFLEVDDGFILSLFCKLPPEKLNYYIDSFKKMKEIFASQNIQEIKDEGHS